MKKSLQVECPKCKEKFDYYQSEFRPFCSKRCQMIDLGKWLSGDYTLPGESVDVENELERGKTDDTEE